ncbi:unnamed protein product [Medioppia subpectinata]|uniref:beta-N-acetylhexosaminidase n=1 Tax=Medioppia subpectinata TaxID=1979941 RepID=A0A7R9L0D6_9ACAR|nr:unnamed protein product [Medioppia subpectinata]CAG2113292.1 unnamed protein product [Medioppia subpectinata]
MIKLLTTCYDSNGEPNVSVYGKHSANEILNPIQNFTYDFFKQFFAEVKSVFADEFIHLGMDEVYYECWESNPEIKKFMHDLNMTTTAQLEQYYVKRTVENVRNIGYKYMTWQDPVDIYSDFRWKSFGDKKCDPKNIKDINRCRISLEKVIFTGKGSTKGLGVSGGIDLWYNSYASKSCRTNDPFDIALTVHVLWTVGALPSHFALKWERLVIDYMPMKDIHFVISHRILQRVNKINRAKIVNKNHI